MNKIIVLTDALGRTLEAKKPTLADQFDLLEAAQNKAAYEQWFGLAGLVFCCKSIDGVPLPTPKKPSDFKKNAEVLKEEGLLALTNWLQEEPTEDTEHMPLDAAKN